MNMLELIEKKRDGGVISKEEIQFFVDGVTDKSIPDYQVSAFLMAVLWRGMNDEETTDLTLAMANSGSICDLSDIPGVKVDKHSTGGVGDKVTPILLPIVASFGIPCVKLSGRGLGFTGGTIDKFESIEGFCTSVDPSEFKSKIENCGLLLGGQTADLAPCDKYLYALRDVTGTVPSIPLIASSIMSKKIAGGSDAIVLDITCGSGAFMKDIDSARELARRMISIGKLAGKVAQQGYTIVPLQVYFSGKLVKVEIALAKGKKLYDKREAIAKKDAKREAERAFIRLQKD